MQQLPLIPDSQALEGAYTPLQSDLDPALLPRLRAARIKLVGLHFDAYAGRWVYQLRADWRGRGQATIDKFAEGVAATLEQVERHSGRLPR